MSLPKMFSYNVLSRHGSDMTFVYNDRRLFFNIEQYPTIVETVSSKVYNVRQSGLVTAVPEVSTAVPEVSTRGFDQTRALCPMRKQMPGLTQKL